MIESNPPIELRPPTRPASAVHRINGLLVGACWLAAYIVCALLNIHLFFVDLQGMDWDESNYIASGRLLDHLHHPVAFSDNPVIALLFALLFIPVRYSPYWLIEEARLANALIFTLVWIAAYWVATRLVSKPRSLFAALLLLGFPFYQILLTNSTDALFTALSGVALGFVVRYTQTRRVAFLAAASLVLGLAAMSRNDGLVMEGSLLLIVWIVERRWAAGQAKTTLPPPSRRFARPLIAALVPFACLVAGYLALTKIATGSVQWGVGMRTYDAFQQGEGIAYDNYLHHGNWEPYTLGYVLAAKKYGTGDDNQWSVLRAIRRNPAGYADRFAHAIRYLPGGILTFINQSRWSYGFAGLLIASALLGLFALRRQGERALVVVMALWHFHLLSYLVTFYRTGYFMLPLVTLVSLSAVGLSALRERFGVKEWVTIGSVILFLGGGSLLLQQPYLLIGALAALGPIAIPRLARLFSFQPARRPGLVALGQGIAILMLGIAVNTPFDTSPLPAAGSSDEAAAAVYLEQRGLPGAVAGYDPGAAIMAKRAYVYLEDPIPTYREARQFERWMQDNHVSEAVIDPNFAADHPGEYQLIQSDIGKGLTEDFRSGDGTYEILSLRRASPS